LQEIIMQLPEKSPLRPHFLSGKFVLSEMMGLFLLELKQILTSYKSRLFCIKSPKSDRAVSVLENNFLDNRPSFSKIMINMTRFMSEKTLTKKPGELFKRLFGLWQAGLWILSRHAEERELFFRISDNSRNSVFRSRMWTEYCWEKRNYLKTTVGDYFMRIAVETHDAVLQLMLVERNISVEKGTFISKLQASLCSESLLGQYFKKEAQTNVPEEGDSLQLCSVTIFGDARNSFDLQKNSSDTSLNSLESTTLAI